MSPAGALRVAILAHSTNPRGGVVHALELGDALVRLGHEAVVHAPDARGSGFFRPILCGSALVAASPVGPDVATMIETRVAEYLGHFETAASRRFDVFHAQDGISSNALATLKQWGQIHRFARTVHHIDDFEDPRIAALQARSIVAADELFVVSETWRDILRRRFGRSATIVGNGVDSVRFAPAPDGREEALRVRLGLGEGPVFLRSAALKSARTRFVCSKPLTKSAELSPRRNSSSRAALLCSTIASINGGSRLRSREWPFRPAPLLRLGLCLTTTCRRSTAWRARWFSLR
jgi:hypothetical protein